MENRFARVGSMLHGLRYRQTYRGTNLKGAASGTTDKTGKTRAPSVVSRLWTSFLRVHQSIEGTRKRLVPRHGQPYACYWSPTYEELYRRSWSLPMGKTSHAGRSIEKNSHDSIGDPSAIFHAKLSMISVSTEGTVDVFFLDRSDFLMNSPSER